MKKSRGRPVKPPEERLSEQIVFRVTSAEKKAAELLVERLEMQDESELFRAMLQVFGTRIIQAVG